MSRHRLFAPTRLVLAAGLLGALGLPAQAVVIETKSGERLDAERAYQTVTALVVILKSFDMRLIPVDEVATVDGVPLAQANLTASTPEASPEPDASPAPAASPSAPDPRAGLYPLRPGTFRTYNLEKTRTTWHRINREMKPRETAREQGRVIESVVGADPMGPVALTETVVQQAAGGLRSESSSVHVIDPRSDGYFLLGQTISEPMLSPSRQESRVDIPPMLWPTSLSAGQTWTVGPFRHLGLYTAGRMQVVGRESVTVPAGTYPDAWRIQGFLHVFGGEQRLREGRLVMEHGTLETTTWFVPGLGPVREESKFHAHQDFFPAGGKGPELPIVVEERATRDLLEFGLGR